MTKKIYRFKVADVPIRSSSSVNKESLQLSDQRLSRVPVKFSETFGQPTHTTHPHLIRKGELIQGITAEEIQGRRHRLLQNIQKYSYNLNNKHSSHMVRIGFELNFSFFPPCCSITKMKFRQFFLSFPRHR